MFSSEIKLQSSSSSSSSRFGRMRRSKKGSPRFSVRKTGSSDSGSQISTNTSSSAGSRSSFRNMFRRTRKKKGASPPPLSQPLPLTPLPLQPSPPTLENPSPEKCMSPQADRRLRLLLRIADHTRRRWISVRDEEQLIELLTDNPVVPGETIDLVAVRVAEFLQDTEEKKKNKKSQRSGATQYSESIDNPREERDEHQHPTSSQTQSHNHRDMKEKRTSDGSDDDLNVQARNRDDEEAKEKLSNQQNLQPREDAERRTTHESEIHGSPRIMIPEDLWSQNGIKSNSDMQNIFIEMCFFARLGFVQPPSCLRCVYRESMDKHSPDGECQQWVPWRKDANTLLHPHHLAGNIVMVKCNASRMLINGETVDSHEWDKSQKVLLTHT